MIFTVTKVIDGGLFEVSPDWRWHHTKAYGKCVRPTGYYSPEKGEQGYQEAKDKLTGLILGEKVVLKDQIGLIYGILICDVEYKGRNLADYFPEYHRRLKRSTSKT